MKSLPIAKCHLAIVYVVAGYLGIAQGNWQMGVPEQGCIWRRLDDELGMRLGTGVAELILEELWCSDLERANSNSAPAKSTTVQEDVNARSTQGNTGRRRRLEVWRRMYLDDSDFHHCLLAARLREVLKSSKMSEKLSECPIQTLVCRALVCLQLLQRHLYPQSTN